MEISKRLIFFFIMMIGMMQIVNAINCSYDETPLIKDKIEWVCYNVSSVYCLSYIEFNDELIQLNPVPKKVDDIGIIDKFEVRNKIVNVYFRKDLLRHNRSVIFGVLCENESFVRNITPHYSEYYNLIDRTAWIRNNVGYIIGFLFIIIVVIIFLRWAWNQRK